MSYNNQNSNMLQQANVQKKQFMALLEKSKPQMAMCLPNHITPDRMARLAMTVFNTNKYLRECNPTTIIASIMTASQLGLEIGIDGQGYLVPYKNTCTFIPGWKGLVSLANNSGRCTCWSNCVYEGDNFSYSLGSEPKLIHEAGENFGDEEKVIGFYACGKVKGSEIPVIEYKSLKQMIKHRDKYNKVGNKHYSYQHFELYGRKIVLLQVLKYMPKSIELANAIDVADKSEMGVQTKIDNNMVIDIEPEPEYSSPAVDSAYSQEEYTSEPEPVKTRKPIARRATAREVVNVEPEPQQSTQQDLEAELGLNNEEQPF